MREETGSPPLIAHLIYRLAVGGLENGVVNLINCMPATAYRHAIICLTDYTDFRARLQRPDVPVYALHKQPGQDWGLYLRLWRRLRALRPAVVHTRNLATLEGQWVAALAGVKVRIHGEHGWDTIDPDGRRYRWLRRRLRPLVSHYIALSGHIEDYLRQQIGVPADRLSRICNGVDSDRFRPPPDGRVPLPIAGFAPADALVIGTVGRMDGVKDQLNLVRAFLRLLVLRPAARSRLRLVLVGDGSLREPARALLQQTDALELAWLPGTRDDIPQLLQGFDLFVLPSQIEGISNTLLEAMASGLPVVATAVGGNPELVADGITGWLVPPADAEALAQALCRYVDDPALRQTHSRAARQRAEQQFSLMAMVAHYTAVYDRLLAARAADK